jgi:hypothetical protein
MRTYSGRIAPRIHDPNRRNLRKAARMNPTEEELDDAIELARIGAEGGGYRAYDGGIWIGRNHNLADARFDDWGLAQSVAIILNAVLDGTLHK